MSARNFIWATMVALFSISFTFAQSDSTTIVVGGDVLRQSIVKEGGYTSYTWNPGGYIDIGRDDDATYYHRYRLRADVWFNEIPQDARINSVKLTLDISNYESGSSKARIIKLPAYYSSDSEAWSQFDNPGAVYFNNLQYDQTSYKDLKNATFTTDVTNAIHSDNQMFYMGMMSLNEGAGPNSGPKLACDDNEVHLAYADNSTCIWL